MIAWEKVEIEQVGPDRSSHIGCLKGTPKADQPGIQFS